MKITSKSRIVSVALAVMCAVYMALPAAAKTPERLSESRSQAYQDAMADYDGASSVTIGGGSEPLELRVYPNGSFGVFIDEYTPSYQYYSSYAYGTVWTVNGRKYATEYLDVSNNGYGGYPNALGSLGLGTLSRNGRTAMVTWTLDNMTFTQSITLRPDSRTIQQSWTITNNTGSPISGANMISGGDTYFAGDDWGYSYWNEGLRSVYVMRDADSGMMSFTADPATPFDAYFAGNFWDGKEYARGGQLPDTVDNDYEDQCYYLQWDYDMIDDGETIVIRAQQDFASAGEIMGTPPPLGSSGTPGETGSYTFQITNPTPTDIDVTFSATTTNGYDAVVLGDDADDDISAMRTNSSSSASGNPTLRIPAMGSRNVTVLVTIPAGAPAGTEVLTLTGTYTDSSGQTQTISVGMEFDIIPGDVFVVAPSGQSASPGDTVYYNFYARHTSPDIGPVSMGISAASSNGYSTSSDYDDGMIVELVRGNEADIAVRLEIPDDAARGTRDTLTVTAYFTDENGDIYERFASVTTTVGGGGGDPITPPLPPVPNSPVTSGGGGGGGGSDKPDTYASSGTTTARDTGWLELADANALAKAARDNGRNYIRTRDNGLYGARQASLAAFAGLRYEHDTVADGVVQVRVIISNPAKLTNDVLVSGYVGGSSVNSVKTFFETWFSNKVSVIHLDQKGSFGQRVEIAAKADLTGLDTGSLLIYSYDKAGNTYELIKNSAYTIDSNGYLHFFTDKAGDMIITDQPLARKG